MFKKMLLTVMLLPTLSWGAACVVPAKDLEIAGLWPGEPVNQYIAKLNSESIKLNFDDTELSREGSLDFNNVRHESVKDLNEAHIGHVVFNIDSNKIVSFSVGSLIVRNMDVTVKRLMNNVGIPEKFWRETEDESFHYLCDNYEAEIYTNKDKGELALVVKSSEAERFNWIEPKYFFTAKDLMMYRTFQKMAIENGYYSNHELYRNDSIFKKKLDTVFLNKFKLTIDDFDMGHAFDIENIKGDILITEFYQKNTRFGSKTLEMKIAYKAVTNEMLVVITDNSNKTNSYGDKKPELIRALLVDY